jgi:hypothetical protein
MSDGLFGQEISRRNATYAHGVSPDADNVAGCPAIPQHLFITLPPIPGDIGAFGYKPPSGGRVYFQGFPYGGGGLGPDQDPTAGLFLAGAQWAAAATTAAPPRRAHRVVFVATLSHVPVGLLAAVLQLTADQQEKIEAIDKDLRSRENELLAAFRTSHDTADLQKLRDLRSQAAADINDVLTLEQRPRAAKLVKYLRAVSLLGIPPDALPELKLTKDQATRLLACGEAVEAKLEQAGQWRDRSKSRAILDDGRAQARAILTTDQQAVLDAAQ